MKPYKDWPERGADESWEAWHARCVSFIGDEYEFSEAVPEPVSHDPVDTMEEAQQWLDEIWRTHPVHRLGATFTYEVCLPPSGSCECG